MFVLKCDRCRKEIDRSLPPESSESADRIGLQLYSGEMESFDLHKSCANEFREEFSNAIRNAKVNFGRGW